ncbi:hypothetical protein V5799_016728 [Amblyomma americanum]|uniref:Uncharacterized protein n=1 Tax=Amblyomma americanum TaxID=6943 RepID=A0AAQ4F4W9_AMBAM
MIVDVFEMVLVAVGAVLTAVLIWLLMRKYDRDHNVVTSHTISPAAFSDTIVSPASPSTSSPPGAAKQDVVVASDIAASASAGGPLAVQDSQDVLKSHPLASPPGGQEAAQASPRRIYLT